MNMKSILALLLALALAAGLCACGAPANEEPAATEPAAPAYAFEVGSDAVTAEAAGAGEYDPTYTIKLKVVGANDDVLYSGTVTLKSPTMTAGEFLKAAITDKGLAQSGIDVGFVDTLGDYVNNSTDGIYWLYTVNGNAPSFGCNTYQLRDGDYMLWNYATWSESEPVAPATGDWVFEVGSDSVTAEAAGAGEYDPTFTIKLKVVGANDDVLYSGTVALKSPTMMASEFLKAAITDKGLAQSGIDVGFVDTLGDYVNNSTDNIYWLYTVNGASPSFGCNTYQLRDGDYMLWSYSTPTW